MSAPTRACDVALRGDDLDNFGASYDEDRIAGLADNGGVINEVGERRQDERVASLKEAGKTQLIGTAAYPMLGV